MRPLDPSFFLTLLDPEALRGTQIRRFAPGQMVVREGERADAAYFILRGRAQARNSELAREMGPGQCIGELALLRGEFRSASVVALEELELLRVEGPTLRRWLIQHPEIGALLDTQGQVYEGPEGRAETTVLCGTHLGEATITTFVRYEDGRAYATTRVQRTGALIWTERALTGAPVRRVEFQEQGRRRVLHLDGSRRIAKLELTGSSEGVESIVEWLAAARPLRPDLCARFERTGSFDASTGAARNAR